MKAFSSHLLGCRILTEMRQFALVLILSSFCSNALWAQPAPTSGSNVSVCNESGVDVFLAMAFEGPNVRQTQGWWRIVAGQCSAPLGAAPAGTRAYYHASTQVLVSGATAKWEGGRSLCVDPVNPFRSDRTGACPPGQVNAGFIEIPLIGQGTGTARLICDDSCWRAQGILPTTRYKTWTAWRAAYPEGPAAAFGYPEFTAAWTDGAIAPCLSFARAVLNEADQASFNGASEQQKGNGMVERLRTAKLRADDSRTSLINGIQRSEQTLIEDIQRQRVRAAKHAAKMAEYAAITADVLACRTNPRCKLDYDPTFQNMQSMITDQRNFEDAETIDRLNRSISEAAVGISRCILQARGLIGP